MKPMMKYVLAALAASTLIPATALAQHAPYMEGYLTDTQGRIVTSGTGLCWEHSHFDSPLATGACMPVAKPVAAVERPAVVAQAPRAPAPAPAKPLAQKMSFSGDALFAFDKSVLKPEGKVMLDGLVQQLGGATFDSIIATGHTDRFGSNEYNQKLSERRAHTVKDYLVSKNIQAGNINAEGRGETQHVTKQDECLGAKATTAVKACLQPDRRVDVELQGGKTITGSR